ncbi:MAG: hypothetical protein O3A00_08365 [Planctomycetota bacterium]|nr:hypothetical protein [Planctomycetota bacterium]
MSHPSTWRHLPKFMIAALLLCLFAGCGKGLEAQRSTYLEYDADTDEFRHLRLYEGISVSVDSSQPAAKQEEMIQTHYDYLYGLWINRVDVILVPFINDLHVFMGGPPEEDQLLLVGVDEVRKLDLQTRVDEPPSQKSPFSLKGLKIRPGKFYQSASGHLCYYHQNVISGATIDEGLKFMTATTNLSLPKEVDAEEERRKQGGKSGSWSGARSHVDSAWSQVLLSITGMKQHSYENSVLELLDTESLQRIKLDAASSRIRTSRNRSVVAFRARLSVDDVKELMAIHAYAVKRFDLEKLRKLDVLFEGEGRLRERDMFAAAIRIFRLLRLRDLGNGEFEASIDLVAANAVLRDAVHASNARIDYDKKSEPTVADRSVVEMRRRGATIVNGTTSTKIRADFLANTLP